jgi:hypothetical protein
MGRIKEAFKHWSAIPFFLKDKKLDLKEANDWQAFHLEGRNRGIGNKTYAWALFNSKYQWDPRYNKWIERQIRKQLSADARDVVFKDVMNLLRERGTTLYPNFTSMLDSMINVLEKVRDGICEVEIEMAEMENRPQRLKRTKKGGEVVVEAEVENESSGSGDSKIEK